MRDSSSVPVRGSSIPAAFSGSDTFYWGKSCSSQFCRTSCVLGKSLSVVWPSSISNRLHEFSHHTLLCNTLWVLNTVFNHLWVCLGVSMMLRWVPVLADDHATEFRYGTKTRQHDVCLPNAPRCVCRTDWCSALFHGRLHSVNKAASEQQKLLGPTFSHIRWPTVCKCADVFGIRPESLKPNENKRKAQEQEWIVFFFFYIYRLDIRWRSL